MLRIERSLIDTAKGTARAAFRIPLLISDTQFKGEIWHIGERGAVKIGARHE